MLTEFTQMTGYNRYPLHAPRNRPRFLNGHSLDPRRCPWTSWSQSIEAESGRHVPIRTALTDPGVGEQWNENAR